MENIETANFRIYESKQNLSERIHDYSNVYLLPAISLFGIITSIINIVVLVKVNNKFMTRTFKYMLVNSVSDLVFLLIESSLVLIRCGSLCRYGYTHFAKVYEHLIFLYLGYVIVMFSALMDISLSIDRLNSFMPKRHAARTRRCDEAKCFRIKCFILIIISASVLVPGFLVSRQTKKFGELVSDFEFERDLYKNDIKDEWLENNSLKMLYLACMIAKGPALLFALFLTNTIVVFKFRNHINKRKLKLLISPGSTGYGKDTNDTNRVTLMSVFICLNYFIGNSLDSMYPVLQVFDLDTTITDPSYKIISNSLFFGSHGVSIFIFYFFNPVYRQTFKKMFLKRTPR